MRSIDRFAVEVAGLPERLLMENAARGIALALRSAFPGFVRPLVISGPGNNGGDGFALARVLREWDRRVRPVVVSIGDPTRQSVDARLNQEMLGACGVEVVPLKEASGLEPLLVGADLLIDALLGVGLARPVEGLFGAILERLADSDLPLACLDVPSGLSCETGEFLGPRLNPALTVALGLPKLGQALRAIPGKIVVADLGFPAEGLERMGIRQHLWTPSAARSRLPERSLRSHKGSFGHVLAVGGSIGKTGALLLAAEGALRSGAGLVTLAAAASLDPILAAGSREAMSLPVPDAGGGVLAEAAADALLEAAADRTSLVVGPGLGTAPETARAVERLLAGCERPVVVDADALNVFAGRPADLQSRAVRVLTPHPGEMARLLSLEVARVQRDRVAAARALARSSGAVVLLKGSRSLTCTPEGEILVNPTGGPGLAIGGTGDVLAGCLAALLAQGLAPFEAASLAAYLHGLAGDLGPGVGGTAGALAARLPDAWEALAGAGLGRGSDASGGEASSDGLVRSFP